MNSWKRLLAGAVIAGIVVFALLRAERTQSKEGQTKETNPLLGKVAPDFQGDFALNGKPVKLSALKGKVVVLDFWAVWCPPCIEAMPQLVELQEKHKDGLVVVGVTAYNHDVGRHFSFDKTNGKLTRINESNKESEQALLKDFAAFHKMDFLVMTLPKEDAIKAFEAYGVKYIPQVVLIDRGGVVRMIRVGGAKENVEDIGDEAKKLLTQK